MEKVTGDLKDIKPGSICFCWGTGILGKIIAWYQKWETGASDTPSHVQIYFGAGSWTCVSAESNGVKTVSLNASLEKGHKVEIYSFNKMTVEQLQDLKSFAYSRVNIVPYDFLGLAAFLGKMVFGQMGPHETFANFCSELVADCFGEINVKIVSKSKVKSTDQTPGAQYEYISKSSDWTLDYSYDNLK